MDPLLKKDALEYHTRGRPGKIEVRATKPLATQRDLSLAYSPGVAAAVLEIAEAEIAAFELTARANLVAVVSNGSAILGLGNRGPLASKPVMEGKGVLFKRFADIDVFDIEIDATTAEEIIAAVKAIAPTFGGINLEDIKAPEAFIVEETLKRELDIPVFHDDQHGTAIISGAALLNACEIIGKKPEDLKIVISGAGASAIATANFYLTLGVKRENILMTDSRGVIYQGREENMNEWKAAFANDTPARTLADACVGADMILGLSAAGVVTQDMVKSMADNPIIFALANPTPEIMPEEVLAVRSDAIIATGRSDYPNQVNNVLGFPFLFRGALDVYARGINEAMKMAAAQALAQLAKEDVPDSILSAYGLESLKFGRDYLIPKPLDPRVLLWVAPAVAQAAMHSGEARREIDLDAYRDDLFRRQGMTQHFRQGIITRARNGATQRVVFPEGEEARIIRAAAIVQEDGIAHPILLGDPQVIEARINELGLHFQPEIINPLNFEKTDDYVRALYCARQRKGMTPIHARQLLRNRSYLAPTMVYMGDADAIVNGITLEYPEIIRPALQVLGTREDAAVSGIYICVVRNRVLFMTDTTVNIDPDAATLAQIAINAADFAKALDFEPRVAMLSFSNFGSVRHPQSDKVREAMLMVRQRRPDLVIDGEMQADTAVVESIVQDRFPFSRVKDANVLVFPDLGSANIAYKLLDRLTEAETIGPVMLGIGAPVQALQPGEDVDQIVALAAFAAIEAQGQVDKPAPETTCL